LSKVGTLGLVARVVGDIEFSIFVQVALLKPNPDILHSEYLQYAMLSPMMQSQIVRKSSTSTMKYIGVGKIGELLLPLPAKDEQCGISIALRNIDEKFDVAQKRSKLLSLLFKSMLHQLMTGRIRVNNTEIPFDA